MIFLIAKKERKEEREGRSYGHTSYSNRGEKQLKTSRISNV